MHKTYDLQIDGLSAAVEQATPDKTHRRLIQALSRLPGLDGLVLATTRDQGGYLVQRKVVTPQGAVIHDDHRAWLQEQVDADGGDFAATRRRLKPLGYRLTECRVSDVYLVLDRGGAQENFCQIRVQLEDERVHCSLFSNYSYFKDHDFKSLRDLVEDADAGAECPSEEQIHVRPLSYRLTAAIDFAVFMRELDELDSIQRAATRQRRFTLLANGGAAETVGYERLDPGWEQWPHKTRRMFGDWEVSSAGRSGARMCRSWAAQVSDYTDAQGQRWLGYIPLWTHARKLAKIDATKGSAYELFGKLEKLDRLVGVPFAWYFYMLHGNLVLDDAGHRIIDAAEQGLIVLPEHDYQVLRRWRERQYGF